MLFRRHKARWSALAGVAMMLSGCSSAPRATGVAVGRASSNISSTRSAPSTRPPSTKTTSSPGRTARSRARNVGTHLLDEVKLPANTHRTKSPPISQLSGPDSGASFCPTWVDVHRFWVAPGSVSSVADAITAYPPRGLDTATGIGRRHSPPGEFFQFLTNDPSGLPDVNFILAQLTGQRVAIRADAIVVPAGVACPHDGPTRVAVPHS